MAGNGQPSWCWKTCLNIIKVTRIIPVFVVLAIIIFCYYVYVFQTIPSLTPDWAIRGLIYLFFHILLFLFLSSYFATIFSPVPKIPANFYLPDDVFNDFVQNNTERERNNVLYRYVSQTGLPVKNVSGSDGPRFCPHCRCIKPDRSHHCSMCSTCVLRYDHHCPWVNNCVHFGNYKYFLLFLFYGLLICSFVLASSLPSFINFWQGHPIPHEIIDKFTLVFLPFIAFLFGLSIGCLLFYHTYLVCRNRTTIEQWLPPSFENGPNPNAYNLGISRNFEQIFGTSKLYWIFPIQTSSTTNGIEFPIRKNGISNVESHGSRTYYNTSLDSVDISRHDSAMA